MTGNVVVSEVDASYVMSH